MTNETKRFLKIGIAYEGPLDTQYVTTLVSRMLTEKGYGISDLDIVQARTAITKFVPVYAKRFSDNNRDLLVFLTDSDGGAHTRQGIIDKINSSKAELLPISVIGVAEPHLEGWVIADEDSVKSVFGLDASQPLPHPLMKPKDRLISIHSSSDYDGTLDDAKITIASNSNLQTISRRCNDFSLFVQSINDALNYIESRQSLDVL